MSSAELRKPVGLSWAFKKLLVVCGMAALVCAANLPARQALGGGGPTLPISGAQFQNPKPTAVPLSDVVMVDASNGFAVGAYGVILRTTDGGLTWVNDPASPALATGDSLNDLHFPNANFGAAVGQNGIILTFDGNADQWNLSLAPPGPATLNGVYFVDDQNGWAVGDSGVIMVTTDGGANWSIQTSGTSEPLYGVHFANATTGWVVGFGGAILNTTDGGTTWNPSTSFTSENLNAITCVDALTCWAVGDNSAIGFSNDGGVMWTGQTAPAPTIGLGNVQFHSATNGFAAGGGWVLHTTNGGSTWNQTMALPAGTQNGIYFLDSQTGLAVGYDTDEIIVWPVISKTIDGGLSWTESSSLTGLDTLNAVHMMPDGLTGVVVGGLDSIWTTMDGGQTWEPQVVPVSGQEFFAVDFPVDNNTGWVVGVNGVLLQTADGGVNWMLQTTNTSETLYDLDMVDNATGWVVGGAGTILKTTDGGTTWTPQTSVYTQGFVHVEAFDASTALIFVETGQIIKTTDGGNSWTPVVVTNNSSAVAFPSPTIGYLGNGAGVILKTTDGGFTWLQQSSPTSYAIEDIVCATPDACVAVTGKPEILKTTDGGTTWTVAGLPGTSSLRGVSVAQGPGSPFWVVGEDGWILKDSLGVTAPDTTPPDPVAAVYDGDVPQMDEDETVSSGYLLFNWEAASDTESGVDHYLITLEMYDNMAETWTVVSGPDNVGADLSTYVLGPFDEGLYRATVVAVNGEGLQSNPASSDGITIVPDTIPPTGGAIAYFDGEATSASVTVDLTVGYDSESGLTTSGQITQATADYDGATCGSFGAETFVSDVSFGNLFSRKTGRGASVITGPDLSVDVPLGETGLCYQFQWTVTDFAGNPATYTSSAIVRVPFVPPPPSLSVSAVLDGLSGDDADFTTSQDTLAVRWTPPPAEAGEVLAYVVSVGTAAVLDDVASTSVSVGETQAVFEGLSLVQGATYYANVAVLDSRETPGPAQSSDGITVDATPPTPVGTITPSAFIGPSVTQPGMTMTSLGAEWTASEDGESGVAGYSFSVGTAPGAADFLAPNTLTANGFNLQDLDLVSGTTYYVTVQAINGAGLLSEAVTSEGVTPTDSTSGGGPFLQISGTGVDFKGETELDVGWTTPGNFSMEGVLHLQANETISGSIRLETGFLYPSDTDIYPYCLNNENGCSCSATQSCLFGEHPPTIPSTMVVVQPTEMPTLQTTEAATLHFKVLVPINTPPGIYKGDQMLFLDLNGDGQPNDAGWADGFYLQVHVPDFAAQGTTCPAVDLFALYPGIVLPAGISQDGFYEEDDLTEKSAKAPSHPLADPSNGHATTIEAPGSEGGAP